MATYQFFLALCWVLALEQYLHVLHFKNEKDKASPRDESRQHIHDLVQVILMLVIERISFVMVVQVNNDEREDSDACTSQVARK